MNTIKINNVVIVILLLLCISLQCCKQAEQCAILVHYKGRCTVKTGSLDELKPQCTSLLEAGLSAEII